MLGYQAAHERAPGMKLVFAVLAAAGLIVPVFMVYLLVYDRQTQSQQARAGITQGWGGPQVIDGPLLVIPFWRDDARTVTEDGHEVTRTTRSWHELVLVPETAWLDTMINPERRRRSIYQAVVYRSENRGRARFAMPSNLARLDITPAQLDLARAELRFGFSDARGLAGPRPTVKVAGRPLVLEAGGGAAGTSAGFHAALDGSALAAAPVDIDFAYTLLGNQSLGLAPQALETAWSVRSAWASPSFQGDFLPLSHVERKDGFSATWRVGNLALSRAQAWVNGEGGRASSNDPPVARVDLVTPVDLYDLINRSVKYGFLFIGFTFAAFLMFDVIGGVAVAGIEYLLVGAALVLFFVMLLAFAEVIGFAAAYSVAAGAIIALISAYSAAILKSRRRAAAMGAMLAALYGVLYVLLNLEDYALLVGSLLLFAALALVMYLTRRIDWRGEQRMPA